MRWRSLKGRRGRRCTVAQVGGNATPTAGTPSVRMSGRMAHGRRRGRRRYAFAVARECDPPSTARRRRYARVIHGVTPPLRICGRAGARLSRGDERLIRVASHAMRGIQETIHEDAGFVIGWLEAFMQLFLRFGWQAVKTITFIGLHQPFIRQ